MKFMKCFVLLFTILISDVFAEETKPIPPSHTHANSICHGYAVARAFGRTDGDSRCDAGDCYLTAVPTMYFERITPVNYSNIKVGDILEFGQHLHSVYVASKYYPQESGIRLDQVNTLGDTVMYGLTISQVKNGTTGVIARGAPTAYFRKIPKWEIIVQNDIHSENDIGNVKIGTETLASPATKDELHWESSKTIEAIMDGVEINGNVQRFDRWTQNGVSI